MRHLLDHTHDRLHAHKAHLDSQIQVLTDRQVYVRESYRRELAIVWLRYRSRLTGWLRCLVCRKPF